MALFTDGPALTINDLIRHDSNLLEVSTVEGINLTTKLALAQEDIGLEIRSLLDRARTNCFTAVGFARVELANVVVTSPIRLWHAHETLVLVYRDAYFNQLNDRYQAKWNEYRSMAKWAKNKLIETGVGIVTHPVARAVEPSVVSTAAAESGGTFYISVSFVNATREEGASSAVATINTLDGTAPEIRPISPPDNAVAWNLYVGTAPDALFLQNSSPLDLGTEAVFYPSTAIAAGPLAGCGQAPTFRKELPRLLQRG